MLRKRATLSNDAFVRLFEGLREGIYIGLSAQKTRRRWRRILTSVSTFGWPEDAPATDVRPLDPERFVDEQARTDFLRQLRHDGTAKDYLLRLRRLDGSAMWIEVTARGDLSPPVRPFASKP